MGGFAGGASVAETDDATWQKMIDINLNAAFYVLRAVIPVMRRGEHGRIIAIGSRQAVQPAPGVAAYAASKAALVSRVKTPHVAELVLLLAGEAGDAITGAAIPEYGIDG